jgi:acetolactate synthase small subunit
MSNIRLEASSVHLGIACLEFEVLETLGQEIQRLAARFQIQIAKTSYAIERRTGGLELTGTPSQMANFIAELSDSFPELEISAPALLGPALVG